MSSLSWRAEMQGMRGSKQPSVIRLGSGRCAEFGSPVVPRPFEDEMPKRAERKLNEAFVKSVQPDPDGKDLTFFFRDIPCLGLRVKPSGVKTYFLQYRDREGRQRK